MEYTVKSNALTVKTRSFGGELTSIRDGSGTEYLWQGDPKYWKGQAPVLFPIVGSLRDKKALWGRQDMLYGAARCCAAKGIPHDGSS